MSPSSARKAIAPAGRVLRAGRDVLRRLHLQPLQLGLVLGIVVVAVAAGAALWHEQGEREERSRSEWAARTADQLENEYQATVNTVVGVRALFASSDHVEERDFTRFAYIQKQNSHLQSFGWSPRVPAAARARFERAAGLGIVEQAPDGTFRRASGRASYYPLLYLAPTPAGGAHWRGLDIAETTTEPIIETGETRVTPPFSQTGVPGGPLGAAITLAVYETGVPLDSVPSRRAAVVGLAGSTFIYEDLLERVSAILPPGARFAVLDGAQTILAPSEALGDQVATQTVEVGGRRWTIRLSLAQGANGLALLAGVGGGGFVVAALLALLFGQVNRRRRDREAAQARFGALVQNSTDLIAVVDHEGRITYQSPAAQTLLGHASEALVGAPLRELLHVEDAHAVVGPLLDPARRRGESFRVECRWLKADGSWLSAETTVTNLNDDPDIGGWVLNTRDISERKTLEAELVRQALHDPLTDLANRTLFADRAAHALERRGTAAAVLFCDLDDFKRVNDVLGHQVGDELLSEVAARLRRCVRAGDTVARLGGDEFALLLEDALSVAEADEVAERVLAGVRAPLSLGGEPLRMSCSVGIATTDEAESAEELLRNADVAMYAAKAAGKGTVARYQPEMHEALLDQLSLSADLSRALENGEFRVYYQPLVQLESGQVVGVEALARWEHPRRGLIAPAQFIPIAEETGEIVELGEAILVQACRQAVRWRDGTPELADLTMNVNLSARQLTDPQLPERVERALNDSGLAPERLVLEITESTLMIDTVATTATLTALKALGVRLAIDDFGTGYSSLGYLQRLPVDQLKVDKLFIEGIDRPDGEAPLLQAMLEIGRVMGLEVTAEGVERAGQAEYLKAAGVDLAQGYYYSRPGSADQVKASLSGAPLPRTSAPLTDALAAVDGGILRPYGAGVRAVGR